MARRPSMSNLRSTFQSEPGQSTIACDPPKLDFLRELWNFARLRCVARGIGSLGDWRVVAEMLNCQSHVVTIRLQRKRRQQKAASLFITTKHHPDTVVPSTRCQGREWLLALLNWFWSVWLFQGVLIQGGRFKLFREINGVTFSAPINGRK